MVLTVPPRNHDDTRFMALALEVGRLALPRCLPNPPVGCVLVRNGKVVATGYTREPGAFHAEADALSRLSGRPDDVVAYVTLEPCSFQGRTPACARALVESGIREVHVAILDPDPRNDGKGIAILQAAGVKTTCGHLREEAWRDLAPYLYQS
ncbi:MAG: bifunctional diaminohydroxyphosphoribosylaminopyrimidine deaminase/5-amino-6-(5-phosphoribosylamino)uracil reductase RibD [Fimbriimonas sp.]